MHKQLKIFWNQAKMILQNNMVVDFSTMNSTEWAKYTYFKVTKSFR